MAIGALTPWYDVEAGAQKVKMNEQVIQENAMKLDEMHQAIQKKREIEELAKQVAAEQAQQGPNSLPPNQLPRGFMPGEQGGIPNQANMIPVGLQQAPTEVPTSPFGTTEQTGVMGGMQEQPTQKAPEESHPLLRQAEIARKANDEHEALRNNIAQNYNLMKRLREKGFVDEANKLANSTLDLETKANKAEQTNLEAQDKILDHIGSVATAAANAIANAKTPQQAANARAMLYMQAQQLPDMDITDMMQMSDADLVSALRQVSSATLSGKEQISLRKQEMAIAAASERAALRDKLARDQLASKERSQAASRELREDKLNFEKNKFGYKELTEKYDKQIKTWENEKNSLDKDISGLEKSLLELQKGNMFYTASGKPMSSDDPEVLEKEANLLADAIEAKRKEKEDLTSNIDDLSKQRMSLSPSGKQEAPAQATESTQPKEFNEKVGYRFVKGADPRDIAAYNKMMSAAKTREEKLAIQKKAFEFGLVEPK